MQRGGTGACPERGRRALVRTQANHPQRQPFKELCIQPNSSQMKLLPLLVLLGASVCQAQSSGSVPKPPWAKAAADDASDIKVNVKLVNIFVTVTDEHGSPVGSLTKDNFQIFEDGHPQKISIFGKESELPLSIVLDIDTSLSTRKDLPLEINSARRFAHAILRPVDALSVYDFSETVDQIIPFTADLRAIDRGLERLPPGAAT